MSTNRPTEYLFDHLVIIGRDSLLELSQQFTELGFQLTPLSRHNLGSSNRLILLDTSYIELLGWEKGKPPQRAEIAHQTLGLDALVFRTKHAEQTYEELKTAGFAVTPVQDLSRETDYLDKTVLAQFKTVRFTEQPIPGLRIYFCQHITPEYVWQEQWLHHVNRLNHLAQITIASSEPHHTAETLKQILGLGQQYGNADAESIQLTLPNIKLDIQFDRAAKAARILNAGLIKNPPDPVDFTIDASLFNHL